MGGWEKICGTLTPNVRLIKRNDLPSRECHTATTDRRLTPVVSRKGGVSGAVGVRHLSRCADGVRWWWLQTSVT
ncbi:MAG: hypothetical protein ACKPHU_21880, partial [Planctomycetaceae bacterium]